jgi:hypothetical protein
MKILGRNDHGYIAKLSDAELQGLIDDSQRGERIEAGTEINIDRDE